MKKITMPHIRTRIAVVIAVTALMCGCAAPAAQNESSASAEIQEETRPDLLKLECVNQHMKLQDGDTDAAEGTCYSFKLDEKTAKAYPEFAGKIDELNGMAYSDFESGMDSAAGGFMQFHLEGWEWPFSEDAVATVTRADSTAFSYSVAHSSYLGGAHGYTYFSAKTIDPISCSDIDFLDVVTDTDDFPKICFEELLDQNPDLVEYFDSCKTDKENLLDRIKEDIDGADPGPVWSLSYDGISVYFEDYAMGSYAAGCRTVDIPYKKHKEIFNGKYFKFKNGKPNIEDQVTQINNEEPVAMKLSCGIMTIGYDKEYKCESRGVPYLTMVADKLIIPDEYPKLKNRFDRINDENVAAVNKGFADYNTRFTREFDLQYGDDPDNAPYYDFEYGIRQFVTRADGTVFSTVESHQEMHVEGMGKRKLVGINIDPQTGKDIALDEVVTDLSDLKRALKTAVKKEYYPEDTEAETIRELKKQIDGGDLTSRDELSWTVGYEGLTFYCNTLCNFSLNDMQNDAFMLFIPYSDYPDLFEEKYVKRPSAYAYQIPASKCFMGTAYINIDYGKDYTPVSINTALDEYGDFDRVNFSIGSSWSNVGDIWASDLTATVVKDPTGEVYMYVQYSKNDGYPGLGMYSFAGRTVNVIGNIGITGCEIDYWAGADADHPGTIMTDPVRMKVSATDDAMGARDVYAECCIDTLGRPRSKDGYWYYRLDPIFDLRVKKKIELDKGSIPAGVTVSPIRISEPAEDDLGQADENRKKLELRGKDNRTFTLDIVYESGRWKYKGTALEELFDGDFTYPG